MHNENLQFFSIALTHFSPHQWRSRIFSSMLSDECFQPLRCEASRKLRGWHLRIRPRAFQSRISDKRSVQDKKKTLLAHSGVQKKQDKRYKSSISPFHTRATFNSSKSSVSQSYLGLPITIKDKTPSRLSP